ncbi:hypothetical protein, partial [Cognatilysobacter lacus]|uniref:HvfC family peptide modification chaperone n=1 Tax=Cognatilysobacter lacus TaxID=1643323 RepID=UPI003CCD2438
PAPALLLLHRGADGVVAFHELGPLAFHLLHRLGEGEAASGESQLRALAADTGATDVDAIVDAGVALLETYRSSGIVLGTRKAA